MATLFAKIKVLEGKEAAFEDVTRALGAKTEEEKGCQLYAYFRAPEPRVYYCLLVFDSYADFLIHQTSEHHETLITPRVDELFEAFETEWLDAVEDASVGPVTEHQSPGEKAAEREVFYATVMPAVVQNWWLSLRK